MHICYLETSNKVAKVDNEVL